MPPRHTRLGRWVPPLCRGVLVIILVSGCAREPDLVASDPPSEPTTEQATPDPDSNHVPLVPPGTIIGTQAPEGWTHLIVKSLPKLELGDVDQLPERVKKLSGQFFTAMLARVKTQTADGKTRYQLDEVAIGMGTNIEGRDTIITPDTQESLGAGLGLLSRMALDRGHERIKGVRLAARTETMCVTDGAARMRIENKHQPVVIRYAVLVDPDSGRLETMMWAIRQTDDGAYLGTFGDFVWLPPDELEPKILHVDSSEFSLGMITENALAMVRLYKGQKPIAAPDDVKALAGRARLSPDATLELEKKLWKLIDAPARPASGAG